MVSLICEEMSQITMVTLPKKQVVINNERVTLPKKQVVINNGKE